MIIGILKENKPSESRVAMTPEGVEVLRQHGHTGLGQYLVSCHGGHFGSHIDVRNPRF